jgi:hypothetical protein
MNIDASYGGNVPVSYERSDENGFLETGIFPIEVYGEMCNYLSICDTASLLQVNKTVAACFSMPDVSNVLSLLRDAAKIKHVNAAISAIPVMPQRERLALLYAMIRRLIESHPMSSVWGSQRFFTVINDAWRPLSSEKNIYHRNEGKQLYLLAKSRLLTHQFSFSYRVDLPPLRKKINNLPARYRPKILQILSSGLWLLGTNAEFHCYTRNFDRRCYLFDADFQKLLDESEGLDRPVPVPILSTMAVVRLLDKKSVNVRETLCQRFGIATFEALHRFEAGIADEIVMRVPYHDIRLDPLLSRWSEGSNGVRRLLHEALALHLVARSERQCGGWRFWAVSSFPLKQREAASEYALGLPEGAIPGFSVLGAMAMRFWELAWAGEMTFPFPEDHLNAILAMPWQLQPTLCNELMKRSDVRVLSDVGFDVDAWSSRMVAQCLAEGHFIAALRALLVPFRYACAYDPTSETPTSTQEASQNRATVLQNARDIAVARIPIRHWAPLIEAMVLSEPRTYDMRDRQRKNDVLALLKVYVGDLTSFNVIPMEATHIRGYFEGIWESVPDRPSETLSRFDVFCNRLNIVPEWRNELRGGIRIAIEKKVRQGTISEEGATMQRGALFAAGDKRRFRPHRNVE